MSWVGGYFNAIFCLFRRHVILVLFTIIICKYQVMLKMEACASRMLTITSPRVFLELGESLT